jgi:hypothetical protein
MTIETKLLILAAIGFIIAVVLLMVAFLARSNKETWGVGAGVLAAVAAIPLTFYFTYQEKEYEDKVSAANLIERYAMPNLLVRNTAIDNWMWHPEYPINFPPHNIYDDLTKDDRFHKYADINMLNLLIGAKWEEEKLLESMKNESTKKDTRYQNLLDYKALIVRVWEDLCTMRKTMEDDVTKLLYGCKINEGIDFAKSQAEKLKH